MNFFNRNKQPTQPPPPPPPPTNSMNLNAGFVMQTSPQTGTTGQPGYGQPGYGQPGYGFQNQLYNQGQFGQGQGQGDEPFQSVIQGVGSSLQYRIRSEEQAYDSYDLPEYNRYKSYEGNRTQQQQQPSYGYGYGSNEQRVYNYSAHLAEQQQQPSYGYGSNEQRVHNYGVNLAQQQQQFGGGFYPTTQPTNVWPQQQQPQQPVTTQYTNPWPQQQPQPQQLPQPQQQQQKNPYPDLPVPNQPQVKNQLGWVEELTKNSIKEGGDTNFIQQIGKSKISKLGRPIQPRGQQPLQFNEGETITYGNDTAMKDTIWQSALTQIFGGNNANTMLSTIIPLNPHQVDPTPTPTIPIFNSNKLLNLAIQNLFFKPNKIFDNKQVVHEFPSPHIKYKIIPYQDEKKVLDVVSRNDSKRKLWKNNLTIWDYHGGPNQLFYIEKQPDGYCYIINIARGFALQVSDPNFDKEMPVQAHPLFKSDWQKWKIEELSHSTYGIVSKSTGGWLDLYHEKETNGTPVILWKKTERKNQRWRIVPA